MVPIPVIALPISASFSIPTVPSVSTIPVAGRSAIVSVRFPRIVSLSVIIPGPIASIPISMITVIFPTPISVMSIPVVPIRPAVVAVAVVAFAIR
jgi:hypothetical protein